MKLKSKFGSSLQNARAALQSTTRAYFKIAQILNVLSLSSVRDFSVYYSGCKDDLGLIANCTGAISHASTSVHINTNLIRAREQTRPTRGCFGIPWTLDSKTKAERRGGARSDHDQTPSPPVRKAVRMNNLLASCNHWNVLNLPLLVKIDSSGDGVVANSNTQASRKRFALVQPWLIGVNRCQMRSTPKSGITHPTPVDVPPLTDVSAASTVIEKPCRGDRLSPGIR